MVLHTIVHNMAENLQNHILRPSVDFVRPPRFPPVAVLVICKGETLASSQLAKEETLTVLAKVNGSTQIQNCTKSFMKVMHRYLDRPSTGSGRKRRKIMIVLLINGYALLCKGRQKMLKHIYIVDCKIEVDGNDGSFYTFIVSTMKK